MTQVTIDSFDRFPALKAEVSRLTKEYPVDLESALTWLYDEFSFTYAGTMIGNDMVNFRDANQEYVKEITG